MEPEGPLPCSQELTTGPYPERQETSSHLSTLFLTSILILSSHFHLGILSDLFPSCFQIKTL
jgi:hypothetical protein